MNWKTAWKLVCVVVLCGCGGSTSQSTTPESQASEADAGDSTNAQDGQDQDVVVHDPETTEEVIETSEPLD